MFILHIGVSHVLGEKYCISMNPRYTLPTTFVDCGRDKITIQGDIRVVVVNQCDIMTLSYKLHDPYVRFTGSFTQHVR